MRYSILSALLVGICFSGMASSAVLIGSYGSSSTMGSVAIPENLNSIRYNPAAGFLVLDRKAGEAIRFGYLSEVGAEFQVGAADNFEQDLNQLMDELNQFENDVAAGTYTAPQADAKAQEIQDSFNQVLSRFGEKGKIKTDVTISAPLFPMVFSVAPLPGVVSLEANVSAVTDVTFLDDPLAYDVVTKDLSTNSRIYVKGGTLLHAAVGYSQPLYGIDRFLPTSGDLIVGARLNLYSTSLSSVEGQVDRDDGKDTGDIVSDGLKSSKDTLVYGADVGVIWRAKRYQLGLSVQNINSPEFHYSVNEAQLASDDVSGGSIEMTPCYTLDGALFFDRQQFVLSGSYDINTTTDLVGDDVKKVSVSGAYLPDYLFLPTLRVGYEKNLKAGGLSAIKAGAGFLSGMLNLDITYGLETTTVNNESVPRRFGFHLGVEEPF